MDPTLARRTLDLAVSIQQIAAPTFSEQPRARFVQDCFLAEGLEDVGLDELCNVYGRLPGQGAAPPLVISAHIDTVFPIATDLQVSRDDHKIAGPGIGDNALGVAGLVGLLWALKRRNSPLPGDIWLVANVGEEGLGDLRGIRAVVNRFGAQVVAYLVLEGMALGQVYHRGLGVRRYRIAVNTAGGHSWVDHGRPSAIHELAELVTRLVALELPERPRTTLNVGIISGGTSINTIAAHAELELDLRSEGARALAGLAEKVELLVKGANRPGILVHSQVIGQRPPGKLPTSHPLVRLAEECLEGLGLRANLGVGSTDANIPLSQGIPAICIGLTTGGGAHTVNEYINTAPVAQGLAQLLSIVEGAFRKLTP